MPTHGSVAKSVRLDKEAHPDRYCPERRCLWRTETGFYCPNHGGERRSVEELIRAEGFTVRYVEYCEDSRTPGLLGQIAGVTDWELREVKIRTKGRTEQEIIDTLLHEFRHVVEPEWDCGNRDVFGRGGPHRKGTQHLGDGLVANID